MVYDRRGQDRGQRVRSYANWDVEHKEESDGRICNRTYPIKDRNNIRLHENARHTNNGIAGSRRRRGKQEGTGVCGE